MTEVENNFSKFSTRAHRRMSCGTKRTNLHINPFIRPPLCYLWDVFRIKSSFSNILSFRFEILEEETKTQFSIVFVAIGAVSFWINHTICGYQDHRICVLYCFIFGGEIKLRLKFRWELIGVNFIQRKTLQGPSTDWFPREIAEDILLELF